MDHQTTPLADLTAAPRVDIVPGHALHPPRFREIGIAEDTFARWYLRRLERGLRGANEQLREAVMRAAREDVRDGWFSVNMMGYQATALSAKGTRFLFCLSIRVGSPRLGQSEAGVIFDSLDPDRRALAVAETLILWSLRGNRTRPAADARPAEWKAIVDLLCARLEDGGRGMDFNEALDLTLGQAMVLLSGPAAAGRQIGQDEIVAKRREAQHRLFDRICRKNSIGRHNFVRLPLDAIRSYVLAEIGKDKPVPEELLRDAVDTYKDAPLPA